MSNKTYKDFGEAIEDLRQNARISYDTIAFGIRRAQSYVYGICTRRKRQTPSYEQMKEFSDFFHVEESYFYEYRLRDMLEFVDKNREFLDHCQKERTKWNKKEDKEFPTSTLSENKVKKEASKDKEDKTA
ncbi:MAG: hypothetical protein ACYCZ1_02520 [Candidatus Humimicrobiaceae bacterium]